MRRATLTLLLALVPASAALLQRTPPRAEPSGQQGETPQTNPLDDAHGRTDAFGRSTWDERAAQIDDLLIGAWRLQAYHDQGNVDFATNQSVGYALFVDGYMSIELHVSVPDIVGEPIDFLFSGTYQYRWEEAARLRLTSLIGASNYNAYDILDFMPPGTTREYSVQVDETGLELTRLDSRGGNVGTRFVFQRMENSSAKTALRRDFFGRMVPVEEGEDEEAPPPPGVRVPVRDLERPRR